MLEEILRPRRDATAPERRHATPHEEGRPAVQAERHRRAELVCGGEARGRAGSRTSRPPGLRRSCRERPPGVPIAREGDAWAPPAGRPAAFRPHALGGAQPLRPRRCAQGERSRRLEALAARCEAAGLGGRPPQRPASLALARSTRQHHRRTADALVPRSIHSVGGVAAMPTVGPRPRPSAPGAIVSGTGAPSARRRAIRASGPEAASRLPSEDRLDLRSIEAPGHLGRAPRPPPDLDATARSSPRNGGHEGRVRP